MGKKKQYEYEEERKSGGGLKSFFKIFAVGFVIFLLILTPLNALMNKVGGIRLFSGTTNLMKDMDFLVDEDSPFFEAFKDTNRVNILALGVNDGMTDVIMVASYDLDSNHVDVISVPRDTYYPRKGYKGASNKINAVYSSKENGGALGVAQAVSGILEGMPINYYMVIDYEDVEKIVDSMNGVPMEIPFHMVYNDPYDKPPLHIDIPKGQQTLDGEHAVQFLRYRKGYPQGDIGRIAAHQEFIKSAFKQALGWDLLKVVKTTMDEVESDFNVGLLLKVATKAVGLSGDDMQTWMVPGKSGMKDGLSFWFADETQTKEMLTEIYSLDEGGTSDGAIEN